MHQYTFKLSLNKTNFPRNYAIFLLLEELITEGYESHSHKRCITRCTTLYNAVDRCTALYSAVQRYTALYNVVYSAVQRVTNRLTFSFLRRKAPEKTQGPIVFSLARIRK